MLTHNYVGLADRTVSPVGERPKARAKADWGWMPYKAEGSRHGKIKVFRPDTKGVFRRVTTLLPGRAKREQRG